MTKKDFEVFANEINKIDNVIEKDYCVILTARVFAKQNPLFNEAKYRRACYEGKHIRTSIKEG